MANQVTKKLSDRAVDDAEIRYWLNMYLVPLVKQIRESLNGLVAEMQSGSVSFGIGTAVVTDSFGSGAPTTTPNDGSRWTNTDNGDFYVRQAGVWVLK